MNHWPLLEFIGVILLGVAVVVGGAFLIIRRYVRRYEAEQRRRGLWDENGPIHPTKLPPWYFRGGTSLPLNLPSSEPDPEAATDELWSPSTKRK
jgi:hypothetical protein